MKRLNLFIIILFLTSGAIKSQLKDDVVWRQGIPLMVSDEYVVKTISTINIDELTGGKPITETTKSICREIGLIFYDKGYFQEAEWYLSKSKGYHFYLQQNHFQQVKIKEISKISESDKKSLDSDANFIKSLPANLSSMSKEDMKKIAKEIDNKIKQLINEKDSLLKVKAKQELIDSKDGTINALGKEKQIVNLTIGNDDLKTENNDLSSTNQNLKIDKMNLKKYLIWLLIILGLLVLVILVLSQRKTIKSQDVEIVNQLKDINKKNTYLEHAARIIRHDMHSGINTYIPRGINSLEKRLTNDDVKNLKLELPIKMIKDGLNHTQKVYKSVYEFTNLVKQNVVLDKKEVDLKILLVEYLNSTSFKNQVIVDDLVTINVNEILFCNAIDNLIRNGLKYNNSENKQIKIFIESELLVVQDNGIGLTQKEFEDIKSSHNKRKDTEEYGGLGLNICMAILNEHGFDLSCEKIESGTKMKIKIT